MPGAEVFTAPWPFLFWRIRSSERFDKSPSPDEVANCAVHRADFLSGRCSPGSIKPNSSAGTGIRMIIPPLSTVVERTRGT